MIMPNPHFHAAGGLGTWISRVRDDRPPPVRSLEPVCNALDAADRAGAILQVRTVDRYNNAGIAPEFR
jgi:hypothetical protein